MKKLLSRTGVITNSSDEVYIVKTGLSESESLEKFDSYMREHHDYEWLHEFENSFPLPDRYSMFPDYTKEVKPGFVRFAWESMCNLEDAEGYLKETFPGAPIFTEAQDHSYASDKEIEEWLKANDNV